MGKEISNHSNFRRYFQFFLVVLAAGAIYPVIYLKTNYQETILQVFNMSLSQLNTIYSVLGIVFMIGYFPSGLLSDKFSAKKLLTASMLGTAVGGFWFAQIPSYTNVAFIFCIWGIFSVFTFWGAHMKIVKMLAKKEEQGRFFGILDGGRGAVEALLASLAVVVFSKVLAGGTTIADKRSALVAIIYMYSVVLVIVGILVAIFVEDDKKKGVDKEAGQPEETKEKFKFSDLSLVFKNKYVYLLGGIIFMSYVVYWTVYYLGGFLETNIGVDSVTVSTIMVVVLWMRPIGGILGGFMADKFGKAKVLGTSVTISALILITISVLSTNTSKVLFYGLIIIIGIFLYAIRGTYWSLLDDCKIPNVIVGTAIGVISVFGYLPDIMLPVVNSMLFQVFGPNGGYNAYFVTSAAIGIVGVILIIIFRKLTLRDAKNDLKESAE